jgi:hypothetical protein
MWRLWISFPIVDPMEPVELLAGLDLVGLTAIPSRGEPRRSADPYQFRNDDLGCGPCEFMHPAPA